MTQPEALRLAAALDAYWGAENGHDRERQAAAELRRLSIENEAFGLHLSERMKDLARVEAQRDALLEALKKAEENGCPTVYANEHDECGERGCCGMVSYEPHADDCWVTTARAAIKAVEENT